MLLVAWEVALLKGKAWETLLFTWGIALSAWEALSLVECLTAWEEAELLPELEEGKLLPSWEIALLVLPFQEGVLLGWTAGFLGSSAPMGKGAACLPAWEETELLPAWGLVLPELEELLPAWDLVLPKLEGGGIASFLGNSAVSTTFPWRGVVRVDSAGFLGSSAVLGKESACLPVRS